LCGGITRTVRGRSRAGSGRFPLAHDQYVFERAEVAAAEPSDFVLVNLFRPPIGAPMSPDAVNELVTALTRRAQLSRQVTPHMLRHAYGSNLADAGGTVDEVQELLGHASVSSTQVCLHQGSGIASEGRESAGCLMRVAA
jgi:site-specific recombinase XerD